MDIQLTKDTDKTLCEIYLEYLKRISNGSTKRAAKDFADASKFPDPDWTTPDGKESLTELKRAGMIKMYHNFGFCIEDKAIIYMENRFKNGLSEVLDWTGKIKSAIPFA
jgi:hypothetical protein